jgi:hypothetical protein
VITGFNTDVQHGGVTYHVQTEDKGLDAPLILSLVYVGGAIIASKRTPYEDLVSTGFDEKALTERLRRQHKLICAAIKAGRISELKRMGAPNGGAKHEAAPADDGLSPEVAAAVGAKQAGQRRKKSEPAPSVEASSSQVEAPPTPAEAEPSLAAAPPEVRPEPEELPLELPAESPSAAPREAAGKGGAKKAEPEIVILTTLADEVSALGDLLYRPAPAEPVAPAEPEPPAVAEAPPAEPEPIPVEPLEVEELPVAPQDVSDELYLHLLDDEGDFRAGQLATVKVYVGRGVYGQRPVFDASVTVKVLGTSFRPIILTTTTDVNGVAVVRALLPRFTSGRAAIIIRATVGEDAAEMRRIIRQ